MNIYGLTKTTLLDYPGIVASTIFVGSCNFRCPFCHNMNLVTNPDSYSPVSENEVFNHFEKRKNIISGVCISGGEPTLQKDLILFIQKIHEYGFKIKLDTNGYRPDILEVLLNTKLVDYVAMDIKSSREHYNMACGTNIDIKKIEKSIHLLQTSNIPYEFRTTCVNGLHNINDFSDIANWLPSDATYFLQSFKENDVVPDKSLSNFSVEEMNQILAIVKAKIPNTTLRGV